VGIGIDGATAQVASQTVWDADAIAASVKRSIRSLMGKRWQRRHPRDLFVALASPVARC
jgi:hypothetical protein